MTRNDKERCVIELYEHDKDIAVILRFSLKYTIKLCIIIIASQDTICSLSPHVQLQIIGYGLGFTSDIAY
jgi:hypothetical protein